MAEQITLADILRAVNDLTHEVAMLGHDVEELNYLARVILDEMPACPQKDASEDSPKETSDGD
jgi:hypothetical protein